MQALQAAVDTHLQDPSDHNAAQQLVTRLGSLREAAEARPKVWLGLVDSEKGAVPALVAGLLQWRVPAALERALQLLMLLIPSPEIPKDGIK